ncbi:MAG TPA: hypothetical protein VMA13_08630, partial [Candidatus Saccharimonadales bacterium]|nr:hypothetical protein [Candidatus Saccharimonadales bacterium]
GHILQALHDNALFISSLAVLAGRGAWFAVRRASNRLAVPFLPSKFLWAFLVIAIAFTVLRNLPMFSFLSP